MWTTVSLDMAHFLPGEAAGERVQLLDAFNEAVRLHVVREQERHRLLRILPAVEVIAQVVEHVGGGEWAGRVPLGDDDAHQRRGAVGAAGGLPDSGGIP